MREDNVVINRKALCLAYAAIGALAFVGTFGNILGLLSQYGLSGFLEATLQFWKDVLVNEASRFITVDLLFLGLAVVLWMLLEARRLKIPGVWLYIVFGLFIAISLAVPLFLIHRERRLAAAEPGAAAGSLQALDLVGIAVLSLAIIAFSVFALTR